MSRLQNNYIVSYTKKKQKRKIQSKKYTEGIDKAINQFAKGCGLRLRVNSFNRAPSRKTSIKIDAKFKSKNTKF